VSLCVVLKISELDVPLQELLGLDLLAMTESKLSKLVPLIGIARMEHQVVDKLFLCVVEVDNSFEFAAESAELFSFFFLKDALQALILLFLDRLKLVNDVVVELVSLGDGHSLGEGVLQLLLEEDVQVGFEFIALLRGHGLGHTDFLFELFDSESEDGLLQSVSQLLVLTALSELGQELLTANLSLDLELLRREESSLLLDKAGVGSVLLLFFLERLLVLCANLLHNEVDGSGEVFDGVSYAGESGRLLELG